MNLEPKVPPPAATAEPESVLLYGAPKIGKSRILSALPCYTFQLDQGGQRQHGGVYEEYLSPVALDAGLDEAHKIKEKLPRFVAVDPLDRLEDLAAEKALGVYQKRFPRATNVKTVADLFGLEYGLGYGYLREEFVGYLRRFATLGRQVIFTAHVRPKAMDKDSAETSTTDLALTGKCCKIICGAVDVIGFLRRTKSGELVMSTRTCSDGKQDVNCGGRVARLANRDIVLSRSGEDPTGPIETFWHELYPSLAGTAGTKPA